MADRVAVMYAGRDRRGSAPVGALFAAPQHPYTVGLLGAIPALGARQARLAAIDGLVPERDRAGPTAAGSRRAARSPTTRCRARAAAGREDRRRTRRRAAGRRRWSSSRHDCALLEAVGPGEAFRRARRPLRAAARAGEGGRRRVVRGRAGETLRASSASRAAASRPSARLVLRLIEPTAGAVRFEGRDVLGAAPAERARRSAAGCRSSSRTRTARSTRA